MTKPRVLVNCIRMHRKGDRALSGNFFMCLKLIEAIEALELIDLYVHVDDQTIPYVSPVIPQERMIVENRTVDSILDMELSIRRAIKNLQPDLYHKPSGQLPILPLGCRTIWGVADLNYRHLKLGFARHFYKQVSYRLSARKAEQITAISDSTRNQIVDALKASPRKVKTIYLGTTGFEAKPEPMPNLPQSFLITFGHHEHKNVETVIRALARVNQQDLKLLVIGSLTNRIQLEEIAEENGLTNSVLFVGHITEGQLVHLYTHAVCLAFLSRHEGFGLPVLEAMGAGCPVVSSDAFALPEVCNDAAPMYDCDDVQGVADEIGRMSQDNAYRQAWIEKGLANTKQFTWERAAGEIIGVYKSAL